LDQLVDKLESQIERYRDKRVHEPRRAAQRKREPAPGEEAA
jgi:ribosome-associated translation inhibitor RaiA